MTNFLKGDLIALTTGEYDDFSYEGLYICVQNFNIYEEARNYVKEKLKYDFPQYLLNKNLIIYNPHKKFHLGNYGLFDEDFKLPGEHYDGL